ncbi:MAG: undecaprenyldiphospho-muramoylpentapeptide beta-N-acetylglucosaminyltransferase [Pseudomonadota bacterium]
MSKRILIMAGGTGGHIIPALVVAEQLQQQGCTVAWLGTRYGLEEKLVNKARIPLFLITMKAIRRSGIKRLLATPYLVCRSLWQCFRIYRRFRPQLVLSMGGFVAMPGGITAWLFRVPLVIHEQNTIAGFTNKSLSHLAKHVFTAFPNTKPAFKNRQYIGNPLPTTICAIPSPTERFLVPHSSVRIAILGGSQGALILNTIVPEALAQLDHPIEIKHQCGSRHVDITKRHYQQRGLNADIFPFVSDMAEIYCWADLVICRAGSMTVSELAAAGIAAILIPFPGAVDDHQTYNAKFLTDAGAALLLPQTQLNAAYLAETIQELINNDKLQAMAIKAYQLRKTDAARTLTQELLHV